MQVLNVLKKKVMKIESKGAKEYFELDHKRHCDILWYSKFHVTEEEFKSMYKKFVSTCSHALNIIEYKGYGFYNITVIRGGRTIGTQVREEWYRGFRERIKLEKFKILRDIKTENFLKRIYRPYNHSLDFNMNNVKINYKKRYNMNNRANFYINYFNKKKS